MPWIYSYNRINNNNEVKICFDKSPEGYYLDTDGFYKKCYESCKICDRKGSEIEHNCTKCKDNYYFFEDSFYKYNCYQKCPNYYYYDVQHKYQCINSCSGDYSKLIIIILH